MDIKKVLNEVTKEIEQSSSQQELQNVKVAYLGKKGKITELLKSLKDLSLEEKKSSGSKLNFSPGQNARVEDFRAGSLRPLPSPDLN